MPEQDQFKRDMALRREVQELVRDAELREHTNRKIDEMKLEWKMARSYDGAQGIEDRGEEEKGYKMAFPETPPHRVRNNIDRMNNALTDLEDVVVLLRGLLNDLNSPEFDMDVEKDSGFINAARVRLSLVDMVNTYPERITEHRKECAVLIQEIRDTLLRGDNE